jgi:hypothetical protein
VGNGQLNQAVSDSGPLLQWFIEMDKRDWDHELEGDFSGEGPGVALLDQVKEDFRGGKCNRWK